MENFEVGGCILDDFIQEKTSIETLSDKDEKDAAANRHRSEIAPKADIETKAVAVYSSNMGRPKTRQNYRHCSLDLPVDLYESLRQYCFGPHLSMNSVIIQAINEYISRE